MCVCGQGEGVGGGGRGWEIIYLLPGSLKENLHVHVLCTSNSVHERCL